MTMLVASLNGPTVRLMAEAMPQQSQGATAQQQPVFRSGTRLVVETVSVKDKNGKPVEGLTAKDFTILEDGEPQTITQFTHDRVPIGLGVLLDISDSMFGRRIQDARAAINRFLFDLLDPGDEYFVLAFNHQPHLLTGWTSTPSQLRAT